MLTLACFLFYLIMYCFLWPLACVWDFSVVWQLLFILSKCLHATRKLPMRFWTKLQFCEKFLDVLTIQNISMSKNDKILTFYSKWCWFSGSQYLEMHNRLIEHEILQDFQRFQISRIPRISLAINAACCRPLVYYYHKSQYRKN